MTRGPWVTASPQRRFLSPDGFPPLGIHYERGVASEGGVQRGEPRRGGGGASGLPESGLREPGLPELRVRRAWPTVRESRSLCRRPGSPERGARSPTTKQDPPRPATEPAEGDGRDRQLARRRARPPAPERERRAQRVVRGQDDSSTIEGDGSSSPLPDHLPGVGEGGGRRPDSGT